MNARWRKVALIATVLLCSLGAKHRTTNFVVDTADPRLAVQFAEAAERYRHDLAVEWLGSVLPDWSQPCPITVQVGPTLGAGGATSFAFDRGEVFGWRMSIQGSAERVLDSVLPHEITHMIYASYFRQPLPRWADEGGATSVEHYSERNKHRQMLHEFLQTNRGIPFNQMFAMKEYPPDIMPLYAQGYSLAEYLIGLRGRRAYVAFVDEGLKTNDWAGAVRRHYRLSDLGALQNTWLAWVREGSPPLRQQAVPEASKPEMLAQASTPARAAVTASSGTPQGTPSVYSVASSRQTRPGTSSRAGQTSTWHAAAPTKENASPRAPKHLVPIPPSPTEVADAQSGVAAPRQQTTMSNDTAIASVYSRPANRSAARGETSKPGVGGLTWTAPDRASSAMAAGEASQSPETVSEQVAHPQAFERPRQVILEWSKP